MVIRKRNAIISFDLAINRDVRFKPTMNSITMDAQTIERIEKINSSQETTDLIEKWRNIVKPGVYRLSNGKWKKYHEPKLLRGERRTIEQRLSEIIRRIERVAVEIKKPAKPEPATSRLFPILAFYRSAEFRRGFIHQDGS